MARKFWPLGARLATSVALSRLPYGPRRACATWTTSSWPKTGWTEDGRGREEQICRIIAYVRAGFPAMEAIRGESRTCPCFSSCSFCCQTRRFMRRAMRMSVANSRAAGALLVMWSIAKGQAPTPDRRSLSARGQAERRRDRGLACRSTPTDAEPRPITTGDQRHHGLSAAHDGPVIPGVTREVRSGLRRAPATQASSHPRVRIGAWRAAAAATPLRICPLSRRQLFGPGWRVVGRLAEPSSAPAWPPCSPAVPDFAREAPAVVALALTALAAIAAIVRRERAGLRSRTCSPLYG